MPCQTDSARADLLRLASFSKWPTEPTTSGVSLVRLAAAGFLYTGDDDGIVCSYCDKVVRGWLGTCRCPLVEHRCTARHAVAAAELDVRAASAAASGSCVETAGPPAQRTVHEAETALRSGDVAARGSAAADGDSGTTTRRLEGDCRSVASSAASSSPSRQKTPHGVGNIAQSTSGDVRDSAAADLHDEEQLLMEENRRLHEAKTCKVCMDRGVNTVFLPCGHLVSCDQCSPKLRDCPVCRTYIRGTVKSIMP